MGATVISADCPSGPSELIEDGVNGFLHPPGDLDGMASSALRLLTDETLLSAVSRSARQSAKSRFCDDRIVPLYEAYYQEILARR